MKWQAVMCLRVRRAPFSTVPEGLVVTRLYLAETENGIVARSWQGDETPRSVGWDTARDVPFSLPVRFVRRGFGVSLIPSGTWVLPYDDAQFRLYRQLQQGWSVLLRRIDRAPDSPYTLGFVRSVSQHPPTSFSLN